MCSGPAIDCRHLPRSGRAGDVLDIEPSFGAFGGLFDSAGFTVVDVGATWRFAQPDRDLRASTEPARPASTRSSSAILRLDAWASSGCVLLSARNVSFAYRTRRPGRTASRAVVRDVSLDVGPGTFVGILGPNGSGKTTLLKLLGRLLAPDPRARSTLDGQPIADWPRHVLARRIAMVPQETHPAFDYSVLELVLMGRYPHLGPFAIEGPADLASRVTRSRATGMTPFEARPSRRFQRRRKAARRDRGALAQQADVLLLDEPTASLDPGHQLEIAALLTELNRTRGLGLVLSTHDLNLAASVCRDLVDAERGAIIASGRTEDVLTGIERRAPVRHARGRALSSRSRSSHCGATARIVP